VSSKFTLNCSTVKILHLCYGYFHSGDSFGLTFKYFGVLRPSLFVAMHHTSGPTGHQVSAYLLGFAECAVTKTPFILQGQQFIIAWTCAWLPIKGKDGQLHGKKPSGLIRSQITLYLASLIHIGTLKAVQLNQSPPVSMSHEFSSLTKSYFKANAPLNHGSQSRCYDSIDEICSLRFAVVYYRYTHACGGIYIDKKFRAIYDDSEILTILRLVQVLYVKIRW
jgi:hypothetical protein